MADKVPIRTVFTDGEATGLAEFQSGETVGYVHGGTGLSTIGTAGQILRVNSGATGYEFADGFSANTISLDATADIVLDADGGNIILKDDTTEFGRFTNSGGQLVIKSSSSSTTAITMSGANVTIAGNLTVTGNTDGDSNITLGDASTDTVTFGGTISGNLVFEGSTDDSFETTLAPGNPSSDITLTLPSSSSDTLVGRDTTDTLTNKTLTSPNISGLTLTDSSVIFEGSTADSFETTLTVEDPTADRTITLPNATGSLITHGQFSGDATVGSDGAITLATVNSDTSAVGSTTEIPVITANAKGLVTSISTASISTVLTLSADSGSNDNVTVGTDTLNFEGGTGITTTVSDNNIKIDLASSPTVTSLILEGATDDSFETTLAVSDPTADRTLTLPNKSGTIATTDDISFPNSTTATHPAAEGNADLADGETPFETSIDAFAVSTGTNYDQMDPAGSIVTVDLGSVA